MSRKLIVSLAACVVLAASVVGVLRYRFWVFSEANLALKTGEYEQTLKRLHPWAQLGDSDAQYTLGLLYALGWGTRKDDSQAIEWFRRAGKWADAGVDVAAPAEYDVGMIYAEGRGVARDEVEARKWFERAAAGRFAKASEKLARVKN